jgi:hypothetical protein
MDTTHTEYPPRVSAAYKILRCPDGADLATVRSAFRRLSKHHHPDLGGSEAAMRRLNRAHELLQRFLAGNRAAPPGRKIRTDRVFEIVPLTGKMEFVLDARVAIEDSEEHEALTAAGYSWDLVSRSWSLFPTTAHAIRDLLHRGYGIDVGSYNVRFLVLSMLERNGFTIESLPFRVVYLDLTDGRPHPRTLTWQERDALLGEFAEDKEDQEARDRGLTPPPRGERELRTYERTRRRLAEEKKRRAAP